MKALYIVTVAAFMANFAHAQAPVAKAVPSTQKWVAARTPDGQPDLQGVWSNASNLPLERPKELAGKEFFTEEEALQYAKQVKRQPDRAPTVEAHYDMSQFGLDNKWVNMAHNRRTSLLSGPDGSMPAYTPEAVKRVAARAAYNRQHLFDGPENRSASERCIIWPNQGPPMLPQGYNSNLQIVQSPDSVAILQEMIHSTRIIPLTKGVVLPSSIQQWAGDSMGHWEGETLVIESKNFTARTAFRGATESLRVTERITRVDKNTLLYQFKVEDPATWTRPWEGEYPMTSSNGGIYEYACHEGNLGMANILSGARSEEAKGQK